MTILHVNHPEMSVIVEYVYNSYSEGFYKTYKYITLCGRKVNSANVTSEYTNCDACQLLKFERAALKAKQPFPV